MTAHVTTIKFFNHVNSGDILDTPTEVSYEKAFYDNDTMYVDNTAICKVVTGLNGEKYLLMTKEGITPKIATFVNELAPASRINPLHIVKVPQYRKGHAYSHNFSEEMLGEVLNSLMLDLRLIEKKNRTVYNCNKYKELYSLLLRLRNEIYPQIHILAEVSETFEDVEKHLEEIDKKVSKFIKKHSLKEIVDIAYFNGECDCVESVDENFKLLLRNALDTKGELQFLKVIDGVICTPDIGLDGKFREVMNLDDAISFTDDVLAGTVKHGMKYGDFTVMSVKEDGVKISCNKYSKEMLSVINEDAKAAKNK